MASVANRQLILTVAVFAMIVGIALVGITVYPLVTTLPGAAVGFAKDTSWTFYSSSKGTNYGGTVTTMPQSFLSSGLSGSSYSDSNLQMPIGLFTYNRVLANGNTMWQLQLGNGGAYQLGANHADTHLLDGSINPDIYNYESAYFQTNPTKVIINYTSTQTFPNGTLVTTKLVTYQVYRFYTSFQFQVTGDGLSFTPYSCAQALPACSVTGQASGQFTFNSAAGDVSEFASAVQWISGVDKETSATIVARLGIPSFYVQSNTDFFGISGAWSAGGSKSPIAGTQTGSTAQIAEALTAHTQLGLYTDSALKSPAGSVLASFEGLGSYTPSQLQGLALQGLPSTVYFPIHVTSFGTTYQVSTSYTTFGGSAIVTWASPQAVLNVLYDVVTSTSSTSKFWFTQVQPPPGTGFTGASVQGHVYGVFGLPVGGAQVTVAGAHATTAPDGSFTITGLNQGQYNIQVSAILYSTTIQTVTLVNGQVAQTSVSLGLSIWLYILLIYLFLVVIFSITGIVPGLADLGRIIRRQPSIPSGPLAEGRLILTGITMLILIIAFFIIAYFLSSGA